MGAAPSFTVVMAAYRTAPTIGSAVASVLRQTRPDLELIVVDDGSGDGTVAAAQAAAAGDPRVRVLERPHEGAAAARVAGIAAGSAPLVSLIDSDDLWMPCYLERMGGALEADPDAGMAYCDAWWLDEQTRRIRRASAMSFMRPPDPPPATAEAMFRELLERNFVYNSVTLRRSVIDAVGPPDRRLRSMIDWEWWLRVAAAGHRPVRAEGNLALYRLRAASMTADPVRGARGRRELWRTLADEYDLPEDVRAELRRRVVRFDAELAVHEGRRPVVAFLRAGRERVARARRSVLDGRIWYAEAPREVADAFPDLRAV